MCGNTREISADVKHTFGDDNICTICGIENPENNIETNTNNTNTAEPSSSIVWWLVAGGVVIVGSGAVMLIIFRKKIWPEKVE